MTFHVIGVPLKYQESLVIANYEISICKQCYEHGVIVHVMDFGKEAKNKIIRNIQSNWEKYCKNINLNEIVSFFRSKIK
jgi:hypothetical protein